MTELTLKPGNAILADWRAIYRGALVRLDPASAASIPVAWKPLS